MSRKRNKALGQLLDQGWVVTISKMSGAYRVRATNADRAFSETDLTIGKAMEGLLQKITKAEWGE